MLCALTFRTNSCDSLEHVADVAAAARPDSAIAVVIDEEGATAECATTNTASWPTALTTALAERGIELLAAHVVDRVAAGRAVALRRRLRQRGHQSTTRRRRRWPWPPVLDGRRLYARRAELQEVIEVIDPARTRRALRRGHRELRTGLGGAPDAAARADIEAAIAAAARVADAAELGDDELARLAWALTDPRVRDTLYALAVGEDAGQAESLWAVLSRTLPEPWRVEALVLLAFSAYARGDGPLAGVSLEAALRVRSRRTGWRGMLDTALQSGHAA